MGAARQIETEQSLQPKRCIAYKIGDDADYVRRHVRDAPLTEHATLHVADNFLPGYPVAV